MLGKIFGPMKNAGPLFLRVTIGVVFLYHGAAKVGLIGGQEFSDAIKAAIGAAEHSGFTFFPGTTLWGYILAFTELAGGALLIVGFLTRYAAVALGFAMVIAIKIHWPIDWQVVSDFEKMQSALAQFGGCVCLLFTGAGWLSLDLFLTRNRE